MPSRYIEEIDLSGSITAHKATKVMDKEFCVAAGYIIGGILDKRWEHDTWFQAAKSYVDFVRNDKTSESHIVLLRKKGKYVYLLRECQKANGYVWDKKITCERFCPYEIDHHLPF